MDKSKKNIDTIKVSNKVIYPGPGYKGMHVQGNDISALIWPLNAFIKRQRQGRKIIPVKGKSTLEDIREKDSWSMRLYPRRQKSCRTGRSIYVIWGFVGTRVFLPSAKSNRKPLQWCKGVGREHHQICTCRKMLLGLLLIECKLSLHLYFQGHPFSWL